MLKPTVCAAALIKQDDKYLLLRKNRHWVIPGGKVEFGETMKDCCRREVKEETNINILELSFVHTTELILDFVHIICIVYRADSWSGVPYNVEPKKHSAIEWYSLDELPSNTLPQVIEAIGYERNV